MHKSLPSEIKNTPKWNELSEITMMYSFILGFRGATLMLKNDVDDFSELQSVDLLYHLPIPSIFVPPK